MTMTRRFVDYGIGILVLAAIATVFSPLHSTSSSHPTLSLHDAALNSFTSKNMFSGQFAMCAHHSLREVDIHKFDLWDELDADIEDELTITPPTPYLFLSVLPPPDPESYPRQVSFFITPAPRPLRC